jgi:hypothetical protein
VKVIVSLASGILSCATSDYIEIFATSSASLSGAVASLTSVRVA